MNADKMKDIKNWTIDAVFDDEKHDTEKIKNVIDTQTLGNIREVSETLYNDLLEMIIKDGESAESIIDIVDCINNDTEEFKKAYECFGDVKKAYECINDESGVLGEFVKETDLFVDYRNYSGQIIRISKQRADGIFSSIKQMLEKGDDGHKTEAKVADYICNYKEKEMRILQFSSKVKNNMQRTLGDIDVGLENCIIEVKLSMNQVINGIKKNQFEKYVDKYNKDFFNLDNRHVIVYVDTKFDRNLKSVKDAIEYLNNLNISVVNSLDELVKEIS